jgi:shikimate kinase
MKIFLCGMPGSGKTTNAHFLAENFKWICYDLDDEIALNGKSIAELFEMGTDHFRNVESSVLKKFIEDHQAENYVLALGGGALEKDENLNLIRNEGILVFIDTPLDVITERLKLAWEIKKRPLLRKENHSDLGQYLAKLYEERVVNYRQSHIITRLEPIQDSDLFTKRLELFTKLTSFLFIISHFV